MQKDILLCNPATLRASVPRPIEAYPLLGHGYVASYLENKGFSVGIFDAAFDRRRMALFREVLKTETPRVVGIYGHISSRLSAFAFAREAHRQGLLTVAGGPDATGYYAEYMRNGFDIVVRGEGEETARALMEWVRAGSKTGMLKDIAGLAYRTSEGELVVNAPRPYIDEIDLLPPPRRDEKIYTPYLASWHKARGFTSLPIMGARGCPYSCAFCYRPIFGQKYRKRSPSLIVAELEDCARRFGVQHFRFIDDTFVVDKNWVNELSDLIQQSGLNLSFDVLARPELITTDLADTLKAMGVRRVSLGMESGSERVLRSMSKGLHPEDSRNAARILRQRGIEFLSWVMLGYPGETRADIRLTRDLLKEVRPDSISISIAMPLKGTAYYEQECFPFVDKNNQSSKESGRYRAPRRYTWLFYLFARRWLLEEVYTAKAKAKGLSLFFRRPLKWMCLAGMSFTSHVFTISEV